MEYIEIIINYFWKLGNKYNQLKIYVSKCNLDVQHPGEEEQTISF